MVPVTILSSRPRHCDYDLHHWTDLVASLEARGNAKFLEVSKVGNVLVQCVCE